MNVQPSGVYPNLSRALPSQKVSSTVADSATPPAAMSPPSVFVMTEQLAYLIAMVRQSPEIREDALAKAAALLQSGELLTSQAAAETARKILDEAST